jgi:hypothetical protein
MNKLRIFFIASLIVLTSALSFALGMSLQTPLALAQEPLGTPVFTDDDAPPALGPAAQLAALAPVNPGDRLVYFSPSDNNGTATVINLWNTTNVTATVNVKGMMTGNFLVVSVNVQIPPGSLRRAISDGLDESSPASWLNYDVPVNFTDSSIYGVLSVPAGVHFDGYIVYNGDPGLINPNIDQGATSLRFSADPLTVLLPAVLK